MKPRLVVLCPPCGPFSNLQFLNRNRDTKAFLKQLAEAKILLRFAMYIAEDQISRGDLFFFEQPETARSWHDRRVVRVSKHEHVMCRTLDQCMYGLKDRETGKPHRKSTRIMTNSEIDDDQM